MDLRMMTTKIRNNSITMQLISIFLMQVLEWVPLSISQTGTGTTLEGEETPHVWRRLQEWQSSAWLTDPKAAVSICSITRLNTTNPMLQVWDNLFVTQILEYDKTVFDQFNIKCSCSFVFYVTNKILITVKAQYFFANLWQPLLGWISRATIPVSL